MLQKKFLPLGISIVTLLVLGLTINWYKQNQKIPALLQTQLENDVSSHLSIKFGKPTFPTLMDRLFGYEPHHYKITHVAEFSQNPVKYCIQVRVMYKIPGQTYIYLSDYPSENFLYLAWQKDEEWHVKKIQQGGVDTGNRQDLLWLEGLISQTMNYQTPAGTVLEYPITKEDQQLCIHSVMNDR